MLVWESQEKKAYKPLTLQTTLLLSFPSSSVCSWSMAIGVTSEMVL